MQGQRQGQRAEQSRSRAGQEQGTNRKSKRKGKRKGKRKRKGQSAKGKGQRAKGKGQRAKGKRQGQGPRAEGQGPRAKKPLTVLTGSRSFRVTWIVSLCLYTLLVVSQCSNDRFNVCRCHVYKRNSKNTVRTYALQVQLHITDIVGSSVDSLDLHRGPISERWGTLLTECLGSQTSAKPSAETRVQLQTVISREKKSRPESHKTSRVHGQATSSLTAFELKVAFFPAQNTKNH